MSAPPDVPIGMLTCGRDAQEVAEHAQQHRLDDHEAACPYCQAVVEEVALLDRAVAAVAESEQVVRAPDDLLPRVMRDVWNSLRPGAMYPLGVTGGSASVAEYIVLGAIEDSVRSVTEFRLRDLTLDPADDGAVVSIDASSGYGTDLVALAAAVRDRVGDVLHRQFGHSRHEVHVRFVDLDGGPE